jgi:hypothetical protein
MLVNFTSFISGTQKMGRQEGKQRHSRVPNASRATRQMKNGFAPGCQNLGQEV